MALKLVTAPPGTGKTLLLIRMIFEYLAEGRRVFSNIAGLKITEVLPIPSDQDWRDLPDGSVVIYDEAHEHPAFSREDIIDYPEFEEPEQLENENITTYRDRVSKLKKAYDRDKKRHRDSIIDIARALKIHRHFGFDIILATQDSADLNTRTTNIVGEHYHLMRPFGFKHNVLFFWRRHVSNPDSTAERSRAEWKKNIKFNKSYFHLYQSANVHTHKANFPLKYILVALVAITLICAPIYYVFTKNKAVKLMSGQETIAQTGTTKDIVVNQTMPKDINNLSAFDQEKKLQEEREKKLQEQRDIYARNLQKQQEREISGCVYFRGKYTAIDEFARPIHEKDHLCKQVIQDADRNVMKTPTRQVAQMTVQNNYSDDAKKDLETARTVEAQRQMFNEP
ncbi:zonular occludens toxin domain-containing protein [Acinetobacter baumannii]|uniref:zonular occludens toxin domain-containing protein n=1 Tax=Acinetobacter baumannii TaxID=470 RepID=UPI002949B9AF|nr:zonular occludens toxin domain-containing protein [Acinetobacter baumannii]MDV5174177.1 zonular occludens toxin domain-containing protein [Acinetobacter baumannii]MDV5176007.1 zonular occludens toxin domain-containing protein [Acinetobacter baumannii]